MLFAQAAGGPPPGAIWGVIAAVCGCYGLLFLLIELVAYFFSRTVARTIQRCDPDSRLMEPWLAYLNMIPCVSSVWFVVTAIQVGRSLRAEFEERGLEEDGGSYGRNIGIASGVLSLIGTVVPSLPNLFLDPTPQTQLISTGVLLVLGLPVLAMYIVYWVRVAGYGRQLADDDDRRDAREDDHRPPPEEVARDPAD